jgi:enoyl-[acyl-carrier protein] reductase II
LLKRLIPVRLMLNDFALKVIDAETQGATIGELTALLGSGRCKKGVFDGDIQEGELEIGQVGALIEKNESAAEIIENIIQDYAAALNQLCQTDFK